MVTKAIWPLNPDHITNDRHAELDGFGIIPKKKLESDLTAIAGRLENPVMIMEFPVDAGKPPCHTQARAMKLQLRPACDILRKTTDSQYCSAVENRIAGLFRNLDAGSLPLGFWYNVENDDSIARFERIDGYTFDLKSLHRRHYLEFDCPILGYRALGFPVIVEGRVLGVIYVGELCLRSRLEYIRLTMEVSSRNCDIPIQEVVALHDEWVNDEKRILSNDEYEELIALACMEVAKFETALIEELHRKREHFIEKSVGRYVTGFYRKLPERKRQQSQNIRRVDELWRVVQSILEKIRQDFLLEYICLFSTSSLRLEPPAELEMVARSARPTMHALPDILPNSIKYNLTEVPVESMNHVMVSTSNPELLNGVAGPHRLDRSSDFVRIFPASFSPGSMVVTWIGFGSHWNPLTDEKFIKSGIVLDRSIRLLYAVVVSTHASIMAATAQDIMEQTRRVYNHEMSQLTSGMDALRETYISSNKLKDMTKEAANDLSLDLVAYLRQIRFLTEKAGMTLNVPRPDRRHFQAVGELLYKFKETFRLEADSKQIQFHIPFINPADPHRVPVYADQSQLEQLLYNLLTNARKYCHGGTKIRMDCRKLETSEKSPHILTVTDFGMGIEQSDRVYELEYRGSNTAGIDGVGLGLYIASQIARAHYGKIEHECKNISKFNIPLLESYLASRLSTENRGMEVAVSNELKRLRSCGQYDRIVAVNTDGSPKQSSITDQELLDMINNPTFEVTFKVTIPSF